MDILERIESYLEEEVSSGSAAMSGNNTQGNPGTTTSKVAKYAKRSAIMTRKKKKKLVDEAGDKRIKQPQDEVDHEDSEQKSPIGQKKVKGGRIGWHLRKD